MKAVRRHLDSGVSVDLMLAVVYANGWTALMKAVSYDKKEMAALLLEEDESAAAAAATKKKKKKKKKNEKKK